MITPQLNINGSSADDLTVPRLKAMDAIMDAIVALSQAVPNGRDYPGNAVACTADREAHFARTAALSAIRDDIYAEAIAIKQQQKEY